MFSIPLQDTNESDSEFNDRERIGIALNARSKTEGVFSSIYYVRHEI